MKVIFLLLSFRYSESTLIYIYIHIYGFFTQTKSAVIRHVFLISQILSEKLRWDTVDSVRGQCQPKDS